MAFEYNNIHFTLASDSLSNWQKINPTILNNEIIIITNEDNNPPYLLLGNGNKFNDLNTEENQIFLSKTDLKKTVLDDLGVLEFKGIIKNVPTEVGNKGDVYIIGPVDTGEQKDYYWYIYTDKGWQEVGNFSDIPQSDWDNDTSPLSLSFIKNKPRIRSGTGNSSILASSARWAMGDNSFAAGRNTAALGQNSWSIGNETAAVGDDSFSEGKNTIANGNCQHVQGTYNLPTNADSDYLHIVGNGISDEKRSNAYTLDKYGNAKYNGNIIAHDSCDYKHISVRRNIEEYTLLTEEPSNWKDKYSRYYTRFEDGTKYIARINPEDEFEPNKYYSTKTYSLSSQIGGDRDGYIELLSWAGEEENERLNQIHLKKDGEIELFKPLPISSGGTGATTIEDIRSNLEVYSKNETDNKYIWTTGKDSQTIIGDWNPLTLKRKNFNNDIRFVIGGNNSFYLQFSNPSINALEVTAEGNLNVTNNLQVNGLITLGENKTQIATKTDITNVQTSVNYNSGRINTINNTLKTYQPVSFNVEYEDGSSESFEVLTVVESV